MRTLPLIGLFLLAAAARAAETDADGYRPLFNGKDLSGWVNVNGHPGTFFVRDGMIVTTGQPTGFLRTENQYENFVLEFEWFHVNEKEPGNSGLFVWGDPLPAVGTPYTRGIEVQVLVNLDKEGAYTSHGDVFAIHGATCKPDRPHPAGAMRCLPSEKRCKGGGEWNHYKVIAQDGAIKLHVNGKEVSGVSECHPRKGYLALESEGAECRFRNLKIKELLSSNPDPAETAVEAQGHVSIFTGLDLAGWKVDSRGADAWQAAGGVLKSTGKAAGAARLLTTAAEYGDFELVLDWRMVDKEARGPLEIGFRGPGRMAGWVALERAGEVRLHEGEQPAVEPRGRAEGAALKPAGQWNRTLIQVRGNAVSISVNGKPALAAELKAAAAPGALTLVDGGSPIEYRSLFVRELK